MTLISRLLRKNYHLTTYQIGVLVARTHRVLKSYTDEVLAPYDLTSVDWAILGLLHDDRPTGMRLSDLSEELGVEAPFISLRTKRLIDRSYVTVTPSRADRRERLATITKTGSDLVEQIEPLLRTESRKWLKGIGALDTKGFITVMKTVALFDQKSKNPRH